MGFVAGVFPGEGRGRETVAIGFRRPCTLLHLTVAMWRSFGFTGRWRSEAVSSALSET